MDNECRLSLMIADETEICSETNGCKQPSNYIGHCVDGTIKPVN